MYNQEEIEVKQFQLIQAHLQLRKQPQLNIYSP